MLRNSWLVGTSISQTKFSLPSLLQFILTFPQTRFAAKEAIIKSYHHRRLTYQDILITRPPSFPLKTVSKPPTALVLSQDENEGKAQEVKLSISHDGSYATATCIAFETQSDSSRKFWRGMNSYSHLYANRAGRNKPGFQLRDDFSRAAVKEIDSSSSKKELMSATTTPQKMEEGAEGIVSEDLASSLNEVKPQLPMADLEERLAKMEEDLRELKQRDPSPTKNLTT